MTAGWVNLFFIIGFWNTCRFTFVRLLRVHHQKKVLLREWQRTHASGPEAVRMDARVPAVPVA